MTGDRRYRRQKKTSHTIIVEISMCHGRKRWQSLAINSFANTTQNFQTEYAESVNMYACTRGWTYRDVKRRNAGVGKVAAVATLVVETMWRTEAHLFDRIIRAFNLFAARRTKEKPPSALGHVEMLLRPHFQQPVVFANVAELLRKTM